MTSILPLLPEADLPPVLVTGGAGYIGSHAALALIDRGIRTVVLDDLSTGSRALVPPGAIFVAGRAGDRALVEELIGEHGIGAILHFAARISVEESVANPALYYRENVAETLGLAEAALARGVGALVLSSTAAVYGNGAGVPLAEVAPVAPINPYGWSKAFAERMLADLVAANRHLSVACPRYFNVAGADPALRAGQASRHPHHLIELACHVLTGQRERLTIFGRDWPTPDGTGVRDYVHVSDLAEAHVLLLRACLADPGQFHCLNLGYGRGASVLEVLAALERVSGQAIARVDGPRRAGDPAVLVAASNARALLGWQPRFADLDAMVGHALAWERKRLEQG
ncbi:UDP-glucose 4-epimerase GalE [Sandarakinorhabdus rubra]|uniref:UDP-glucose 4-epimerase GalE n=1 Tax=Sandarakinorhabdus rubra TaxID=2672568 RepID=UPI0013DD4A50|nr:UDP-glucose 4-epimerase GalE [Sandarakinorhabdus rubra]